MMKRLLILLLTLTACSDLLWAQQSDAVTANDADTLHAVTLRCVEDLTPINNLDVQEVNHRPITSTLEVLLGSASVRNTYLAPLLYTGQNLGLAYERARRWKNLGMMSLQTLSGQFTMGEDKGGHSENWSGRLRYRYAAHCDWDLFFLTLMAGPYAGAEVGFDSNLKMAGGNNPATARLAFNTGLSLMGATHYRLFGRMSKASLLVQTPLLGYAMMPEYGASYYESFMLDNVQHMHHFTSLHNQQDLDVRLTTDFPLLPSRAGDMRLGVAYHIETMKINHTVNRFSSIEAIIGWTIQSLPFNRRNQSFTSKPTVCYEAY